MADGAYAVRWLFRLPALAQFLPLPFTVLFLTLPATGAAVPMFIGVAMFGSFAQAPLVAAVQGLAKVRMRALAAALVSFTVNLFGIGLGPLVAGAASDALQPAFGDQSLRYALLLTTGAMVWAGVHFMVGARSLVHDLQHASVQ